MFSHLWDITGNGRTPLVGDEDLFVALPGSVFSTHKTNQAGLATGLIC